MQNGGVGLIAHGPQRRPLGRLSPRAAPVAASAERQGDQYIVDGREIHTVQLVGTFSGLEEHSTNILFKLNDGTDILECRQWIDKESLKHKKVSALK